MEDILREIVDEKFVSMIDLKLLTRRFSRGFAFPQTLPLGVTLDGTFRKDGQQLLIVAEYEHDRNPAPEFISVLSTECAMPNVSLRCRQQRRRDHASLVDNEH